MFKCPQYPKGCMFYNPEKVLERNWLGHYEEYFVGKCIITNNRVWLNKNPYMRLKPKHLKSKWYINGFKQSTANPIKELFSILKTYNIIL